MTAFRSSIRPVPCLLGVLLAGAPAAGQDAVTRLPGPAPDGSGMYSLASSPEGVAFLGWVEEAEGGHAFRVSELLTGPDQGDGADADGEGGRTDRWSAPRLIAEGADWFVNWADHPGIAAFSPTSLAAHWQVRNPEAAGSYGYGFRMATSTDRGATWREIFSTGLDNTESYSGFVSYAPDQGGFSAVYLAPAPSFRRRQVPDAMTLRVLRVHAQGYNLGDLEIDPLVCNCCPTAMTVVAGEPLAVVRDRVPDAAGDDVRDIAITRKTRGRWQPPRPVHADGWKLNACPVNGPVAAAAGEQVAVAWFTMAGGDPEVRIAFSANGGADFEPPLRLDGGEARGQTALAMLDDQSAVVAWREGERTVMLRRAFPDGRLGPPFRLAESAAGREAGVLQLARVADQPPPPDPDADPVDESDEALTDAFDPRERVVAAWRGPRGVETAVVRPAALEN